MATSQHELCMLIRILIYFITETKKPRGVIYFKAEDRFPPKECLTTEVNMYICMEILVLSFRPVLGALIWEAYSNHETKIFKCFLIHFTYINIHFIYT